MLLALRNLPFSVNVFTNQGFHTVDEEPAGPPRKAARTEDSDDISDSRRDTIQQDEDEVVQCRNIRVLNLQGG
jgi:hypothetical protein